MSVVDDTLRLAREAQPDLWTRTEAVARIIAPEAFEDDWIVHPPEYARLHALRLRVLRAHAMGKAQAVLAYLGVNTETDWYAILTRFAGESSRGDGQ